MGGGGGIGGGSYQRQTQEYIQQGEGGGGRGGGGERGSEEGSYGSPTATTQSNHRFTLVHSSRFPTSSLYYSAPAARLTHSRALQSGPEVHTQTSHILLQKEKLTNFQTHICHEIQHSYSLDRAAIKPPSPSHLHSAPHTPQN